MEPRRLPLGAVAKDDGSVVVPESRRADGSVRKEIRIRKGYVPQDEQPVYRPRGRREPSTRAPPASAVSDLTAGIGSISLANEEKASPEANRHDEEEEKPAPTSLQQRARHLPIGAVETASGDVIIPSSQRPDGTFRKEIKVRKGYVPQDEQPMYRPRALRNAETSQPMRTADTLTHDQTPPARSNIPQAADTRPQRTSERAKPREAWARKPASSTPPASTPPPPSSTVHPNRRRHIEL